MKTYSQKSSEINREWWIIDAGSMPLGKLAVVIADKLLGKSKVTFTPHTDNGDSGFPGGLTDLTLAEVIEKDPSLAIKQAVAGMLPKNKLQADRLARLRIFEGAEHAHTAQTPKEIK